MPIHHPIALAAASLSICVAVLATGCNKLLPEKPEAKFSYTKNCNGQGACEVKFINESVNAESYQWNLGEGITTVAKNPTQQFNGGVYRVVSLTAIGREAETTITDTVFLVDRPSCESRGNFACARKLAANTPASSFITDRNATHYYFFSVPQPTAVSFELRSVPEGGEMRVEILGEANTYSTVLASGSGRAGDVIKVEAGPLQRREYYVRVSQWNPQENSKPYAITYSPLLNDVWELNNSFADATAIVLGQTLQGTIQAKNDNDYYFFKQLNDGVIDIKVTPVPRFTNSNRLVALVYDNANAGTLIDDLARSAGESLTLSVGPIRKGIHYVRLYGTGDASSADPYFITVTADTSDKYENNNSYAEASQVAMGQLVRASIKAAKDIDYYMFTAVKTGPVTLTIPSVPETLPYLYLELYGGANSSAKLGGTYDYTGKAVIVTKNVAAGERYYVKVYSSSAAESGKQYELKIQQP